MVVDFSNKPLNEIVGNDEKVLERAKEMAERLHIDIFTVPLKELPFYKEYLRYFDLNGIRFQLPLFSGIFDFDLLIKLIAGSHSNNYDLVFTENGNIRVVINVSTEYKTIQKNLDELELPQIARMYNIYLNEFIEYELLQNDNSLEKNILLEYKKMNLSRFYTKKSKIIKTEFYKLLYEG